MRRWTLLAVCGMAVVLPGCSISIGGEDTVERSSEVEQARQSIAALPALPATESIDCPDDVEAKAGTTYECHATLANGQELTLPARVASVDGDTAELQNDLDVVSQPLAVALVYQSSDIEPESVDCPADVPATVGETFDCKATFDKGNVRNVTATLKVVDTTPQQNLRVVGVQRG